MGSLKKEDVQSRGIKAVSGLVLQNLNGTSLQL